MIRFRVEFDEDADYSYLETDEAEYWANGAVMCDRVTTQRPEARDLSGVRVEVQFRNERNRLGQWYIVAPVDGGRRRLVLPHEIEMPWAEYKRTYGDSGNYVSFYVVAEKWCPVCGEWSDVDALGGVDFYLYGDEKIPDIRTYSADEIRADFPVIAWNFSHLLGSDDNEAAGLPETTRYVLLTAGPIEAGYSANWAVERQSNDAEYLREYAAHIVRMARLNGDDPTGLRWRVVDTLSGDEVTA